MRPRFARSQAEAAGSFKQVPVLRLLPVVIIAAVFMLGFRVQVVVRDIANIRTATVEVGQTALAQNAAPAPAAAPAAPPAAAPAAPAAATPAAEGALPPPKRWTPTPRRCRSTSTPRR